MPLSQEQRQGEVEHHDQPNQGIPPRGQNKANWYFASLLLGEKDGSVDDQGRAVGFFHRLSIGIVKTCDWFHPSGVEEWISITNAALVEQMRKFLHWSKREILEYSANYRFAYLSRAIRNRIVDEIRRVEARPFEVATSPDDLDLLSDPALHPDVGLQRDKNIRTVEAAKEALCHNKPVYSVLDAIGWLLRENVDFDTVRDAHARLAETIAKRAEVSSQQACKYIRRFAQEAATEPTVRRVVTCLDSVAALDSGPEPKLDELEGCGEKGANDNKWQN